MVNDSLVPTDRDFWLTRDIEDGQLSPFVDIWVVRPRLESFDDGDAIWLAPLELVDITETHYGLITADQALIEVGTIPETVRECIKAERGIHA